MSWSIIFVGCRFATLERIAVSIAVVSLIALVVVIVVSCVNQKLNPGLLALSAALLIGFFYGGMTEGAIVDFFPSRLFVMIVAMSLVFGSAHSNGTLEKITQRAIYLIKGQRVLLPILIFVFAFMLSAIGPGNIITTAVLAPLAMLLAKKHKVSEILIGIMLCTGANAGALSPFAPTGVILIGLLEKISLSTSLIWVVFLVAAVLQSISAFSAYFIFLIRTKRRGVSLLSNKNEQFEIQVDPFTVQQKITVALIGLLLAGVLIAKLPLTVMAVFVAVLLFVFRVADEETVIKLVPWSTIIMVSGIAILISLMEKTGGLTLATDFIVSVTSSGSINAVLAFVTGLVSAYSSSSGVVMPAFIPLLPGLAAKMNITDIVPLVIAVAVGSHMVDVSPLSTLGALTIAAIEDKETRNRTFKYLMVWGMSMSIVGGILAFVFLDVLR
ncbi:hypothetical protein KA017_00370 [Candidatus Woesebacteria bacterium]|nr:hypothetical protein [Candidatus Woesebacteria bacterium]